MEAREYKPGEKVIKEDEPGELLYVGVKGEFSVFKNGNRVAQLEEGAVFGEIGFINGMPRTADVISTGKSLILVLSRSKVRKLLASEPQIASHLLWSLCKVLNDRLANTTKELSSMIQQGKKKSPSADEPIGLIEDGEENRAYIFNEIKKGPKKPIPKFDDEK
jgi:CRP-like cAMP-binding protein